MHCCPTRRATSRQCDLFSTRGKLERVWDPADTATFGATGYGDVAGVKGKRAAGYRAAGRTRQREPKAAITAALFPAFT